MANRVTFHDADNREAMIGASPSGMLIVQAEVGTVSGASVLNGDMTNDEQWMVEQADIELPEGERLWSAVHSSGRTQQGQAAFNGINNNNRVLVFFTSTGFIYRIRKNAPNTANTNVAFTWDQGNYKLWI